MVAYKITAELDLKKIIAESREVVQAFNELADNLENIEKKYAYPQESEDNKSCDNCKHYTESWDSDACDGCCGANSKWSGESYPGEFEAMEHNGRMDALESEEQA